MKIQIHNLKLAHQYLKKNGYSLISTMLIMMLMVVLAFAMLSFSSTYSSSERIGDAQSEARANARMALMIAIGELQMYSGPDTRITAPADIVASGAPPLTGVWKSWEGTNHDSDGRPIKPDYTVKDSSESSGGRFLTWLVSGAQPGQEPLSPAPATLVSTVATANTIPLLSSGTLGTNPRQVHVVPQLVNEDTGAIGWWVSPENQKARIQQPHSPKSEDAHGWASMMKTHTIPDVSVFGLEAYLDDREEFSPDPENVRYLTKTISRKTMEFLGSTNSLSPNFDFHNFSVSAIGLQTNVATGGWKKDLSLLSEKWDQVYSRYDGGLLPLFRYAPLAGETSAVPKPTTSNYDPDQSSLYPWSDYTQIGMKKNPMSYVTAAASWQSLIRQVISYKSVEIDSSGLELPSVEVGWNRRISDSSNSNTASVNGDSDYYKTYHEPLFEPVLGRMQLIVQTSAVPYLTYNPTGDPSNADRYYRLNWRVVPIVTMWNPYNITLKKPMWKGGQIFDVGVSTMRSLPTVMSVVNATHPPSMSNPSHPDGVHQNRFRLINGGNSIGIDGLLKKPDGTNHWYDYQMPANQTKGYTSAYYGNGVRSFTAWLPLEFSLKPGEVKVFSPVAQVNQNMHTMGIRLKEGYEVGSDAGMPRVYEGTEAGNGNRLYRPATSRSSSQLHITDRLRFAVKSDRHTKVFTRAFTQKTGAGSYFALGTSRWPVGDLADLAAGVVPKGVQNLRSVYATSIDDDWAQVYWPSDQLVETEYGVDELVPGGGNPYWTNLFSISFGPRFTIGAGYGNAQNRPTKGYLQSNPFAINSFSIPEKQASYHPANGVYDFAYHSMSFNSGLGPEVGTEGYIISGFQSGEGLSRMISAELPITPLASLGELQTWNVRGFNPLPPHQFGLIGNSEATPLIPQDSVVIANPATVPDTIPVNTATLTKETILQHDDAYCANHLLFDDWFFSSIAPKPVNFGNVIEKNIETVYRDFLQGNDVLQNRAYQPIPEDLKLSTTKANERVAEYVNSSDGDGWLKVASRLEVNGMFNVNSTSVKSWRALLGHARNRQMAIYDENSITLDTTEYDNVVTRTTVAGGIKAGSDPVGALPPNGSEYTGFRTLSDAQLDELAENIVEQVRARGPFLSLSEFINRQLSTNDELSIAGALQVALDSLTDDPNAPLKDASLQLSEETMDPADDKLDGVGYAYEEAAEGYSTHGFPGWIRQADILRPIAPVLTARDDTFTIRAYGDYRDANGDVIATAWCEATVQRRRDFVDPADDAASIEPPTNAQNVTFGRRYDIVAFRWLPEDEV